MKKLKKMAEIIIQNPLQQANVVSQEKNRIVPIKKTFFK